MPRVSVIIPNWNGAKLLDTALACVLRQTSPAGEILVVDNGSRDDSVATAERAGARVIELGENRGFCRAINEGLRAATSAWVAILNNDVEAAEDWLEKLLPRPPAQDAWFPTGNPMAFARPTPLDDTREP